jgi:hypothetical protein
MRIKGPPLHRGSWVNLSQIPAKPAPKGAKASRGDKKSPRIGG